MTTKNNAIVSALIAAAWIGSSVSAEHRLTLEDFESAPGWVGLEVSAEDPVQGRFCGAWTDTAQVPTLTGWIPHDLSGFDRLSFWCHSSVANNARITILLESESASNGRDWDYFFYHMKVDWTGWKRICLDLRRDFAPCRKPLGLDRIHRLSFNASGWQHAPLADTRLRLDDIMLVRDPISLERITSRPTPDGLGLVHSIDLVNRDSKPRGAVIEIDASELRSFSIRPSGDQRVEVPGDSHASVKIEAGLKGEGRAEPLSIESFRLRLRTEGAETASPWHTLRAIVPLEKRQHPLLFASAERLDELRRLAGQEGRVKAIRDSYVRSADAWLEKDIDLPDHGGQWSHHYVCKKCGIRLKMLSPTQHQCPHCKKIYSGWPYDDVHINRVHHGYLRGISDLALAYAFTGREDYAAKAVEILLGYADLYKGYALHNVRGKNSRSAARLFAQTLDESVAIIDVAWAYDLVFNCKALDDERRRRIEDDFFREVAAVIRKNDAGISNWQSWHNAGMGAIGLCLQDSELAAHAINGRSGLRFQLGHSVLPDGFWYEGTPAYHFYALRPILRLGMMARQAGIEVFSHPSFKTLFDAPLGLTMPDDRLPALNDSDVFSILGTGYNYQAAYAIWKDENHVRIARSQPLSLDALMLGLDGVPEVTPKPLSSRDFPGVGAAVLRNKGAFGPNYLLLDYGPHGGGHGHPDKLNIVYFAAGAELAPDPGRLAYGAPLHGAWYKQTIAHNTVAIDKRSQNRATGKLHRFDVDADRPVVRASCDTAYPGVTLDRTLILLGEGLVDVFCVSSEKEHCIDWIHHNRGELSLPQGATKREGPLGKSSGYQHAELTGSMTADEAWAAQWKLEGGKTLSLTQLGAPKTEVFFAKGIDQPPTKRTPMIVSRRHAKATVYVTVIEISDGEPTVLGVGLPEGAKPNERPGAIELLVRDKAGNTVKKRIEIDKQ